MHVREHEREREGSFSRELGLKTGEEGKGEVRERTSELARANYDE